MFYVESRSDVVLSASLIYIWIFYLNIQKYITRTLNQYSNFVLYQNYIITSIITNIGKSNIWIGEIITFACNEFNNALINMARHVNDLIIITTIK